MLEESVLERMLLAESALDRMLLVESVLAVYRMLLVESVLHRSRKEPGIELIGGRRRGHLW